MSIKQLPSHVAAQIQSSVDIASLNAVLLGLLKNSLDAGANQITLSVDYRRGNCSVTDNGHGIPPAEFREGGGLGKLHCTSKYPFREGHGRYGTFLASVASLSLVSVTSHHRDYNSHNSMTLHNSKVIARDTPALPEQRLLALRHGTRVVVRDLFGTMPVRVKQRALEAEKSVSAKEFDQLILRVVALLRFWHLQDISVDIREVPSLRKISLDTSECTATARVPTTRDDRIRKLLTQASLLHGVGRESFTDIEVSGLGVSIRGTMCLVPSATQRLQFIALGVEPIFNDHGLNTLYEEVNRAFSMSAFGVVEGDGDIEIVDGKQKSQTLRHQVKDLKARKGIDRWPIFALQIEFEDRSVYETAEVGDLLSGHSPTLEVITDLLRALAYHWLKKHHFRPKPPVNPLQQVSVEDRNRSASPVDGSRVLTPSGPVNKRPRHSSPMKSGIPRSSGPVSLFGARAESPFDSWSRVKTGRPLMGMKAPRASSAPAQRPKPRLLDQNGKLVRKPFGDTVPAKPQNTPSPACQEPASDIIPEPSQDDSTVCVDPVTKIRFEVNSRTGFVLRSESMMNKRITLPPPSDSSKELEVQSAPWLREMLSTWRNPAYAPVEPRISRVPDPFEASGGQQGVKSACGAASALHLQERVSRDALRDAKVIAQVDAKFILVSVRPESRLLVRQGEHASERNPGLARAGELLVLIDQHAADERCRVEDLQKAYFQCSGDGRLGMVTAVAEPLDRPLVFEVSEQEGSLLVRFKQHFGHWGIIYTALENDADPTKTTAQGLAKIQVHKLPPSILERCRLEPRVLIELLRTEVWRLHDGSKPATAVASRCLDLDGNEGEQHAWARRFHGCPQGILDLIYSRACRSAVMFNDHLSIEQCRDLVQRLAASVFPFQCAHGRPSMAPLVDLGTGSGLGSALPEEGELGVGWRGWANGRSIQRQPERGSK